MENAKVAPGTSKVETHVCPSSFGTQALDLDNDGQITEAELVAAARTQVQLKQTAKNLKITVVVISAACMAIVGVLLGVVVLANELSKDFRPTGATGGTQQSLLTDTAGVPVSTTQASFQYDNLTSLLFMTPSDLDSVKQISIVNDTEYLSFSVTGYRRSLVENRVSFELANGGTFVITESLTQYIDSAGANRPLVAQSPATRRHLLLFFFRFFTNTHARASFTSASQLAPYCARSQLLIYVNAGGLGPRPNCMISPYDQDLKEMYPSLLFGF
mmetsp:Transcript_17702/g.43937  ORF Transcript_17702/g.43937 Transcript_17702/m.43937 type:complete len:273 (-) Transcript_17702:914-1732(-)|eukprot:CAMPEP_0113875138 /NCGR_PEP_ID=MMETSP0780_2-20120614/4766_1 /TAXON_ID=652834 /ORGANISM="Palpitomonas bilix" /LENGTH=272 /DNA_ID=CAMNT_0000861075 /DNA_START=71 /DNA_END=889 /DNA_ORIENTATION=+ /assembly_acc=CAM_ASM_000599